MKYPVLPKPLKTPAASIEADQTFLKQIEPPINYKFSEDRLLQEFKEYIDNTYRSGHYSRSQFQATEFIVDSGHGVGFCVGNVMKYAQRYGRKDGFNRKDLLKILHYALIL